MERHAFAPLSTPAGPGFLAWSERGVTSLALGDDPAAFAAGYRARTGHHPEPVAVPPAALAASVARVLDGGDPTSVAYDLQAVTPFTRDVLGAAATIPAGEVRSYRWLATRVGRPRAARAVGSALGRNPVPLLIPCHRVVRGDGEVGGFALGTAVKQALLDRERPAATLAPAVGAAV